MTESQDYFDYLRRRSRLGLLYRNGFLYPRLNWELRGRALDVGCGIGDMLRFRPGMVGVDVDPRSVGWCRAQGLNAVQMELDRLPFSDGGFDSVNLDNVLEHLVEPRPLLAEIRRVLAPGGRFLIGVPGTKGYASDSDHKIFYDRDRLRDTVSRAGFSLLKMFNMPLRSRWLDHNFRAYTLFGVFARD
jgi:SAM-dependent methyltransferase